MIVFNRFFCVKILLLALFLFSCFSAKDELKEGSALDYPPNQAEVNCKNSSTYQNRALREIRVGEQARQYRLSTPDLSIGQSAALLMAFQGGDGGDHPFPQQSIFDEIGSRGEVIMVYPIAEHLPQNEGAWQINTSDGARQDINFVEAIIDDLASQYCLDLSRVYATGYSLGSMFTYELACHLNEQFAAIASYAGTMPVNPKFCEVSTAIPILHIHGQNDSIIPYSSSWNWKDWDSVGEMTDIPSLIDFWSEKNSCRSRETRMIADNVEHIVHSNCNSNSRVEHYRIIGQGHRWPQSIGSLSTAEQIWEFLSGFSIP